MPGLYLHIPFCRRACNYCDFHFSTSLQTKPGLIKAMVKEIQLRRGYLEKPVLSSLYFGGGTPSLLNDEEIKLLLEAVYTNFTLETNSEVTLEANPDDIHPDNLTHWLNSGINRLSIGLQSFNDAELSWMNRAHNAGQSLNCIKMARNSGFNNLSIDLIYGSKFQTLSSWKDTLKKATELKPEHISAYNLTIEEKTVLGTHHKKGLEPSVNESLSSQQFVLMKEVLADAGYLHYEVSNFALPGFIAQHNSSYWKQASYLGIGPSAHSFNGHSRQWNVKNNRLYIQKVNQGGDYYEREELTLKDKYNEYVLTRLRTIWGCNSEEMKALFGESLVDYFKEQIKKEKHLLTEKEGTYKLNAEGLLRADAVASNLFAL